MREHARPALGILLVLALAGLGCSSSDDSTSPEPTVPTVTSVTPADGAIHVDPGDDVLVRFSVPMDEASVEAATTLSSPTRVDVSFEAYWLAGILSIDPLEDLERGVVYTLTVGTGAESAEGEPLATAFTSSFTTLPSYPVVLSTNPADDATGVPLNASVHVQFSMGMDEASTEAAINVNPSAAYTFEFDGDNFTLDFTANLAASTTYTVTIDESAAASGPGATLSEDHVFSFTTGSGVDNTPPSILSYSPANGATNVSRTIGQITITFSEPIRGLESPDGLDLRLSVLIYDDPTLSPDGTVLTVPLLRLPAGCTLFVDLGPFQDAVGNWSADPPVYSFTTAGTADFFPAGPSDWWEYYRMGEGWDDEYLIKAENVTGGDFDLSRYRPDYGDRQPEDYTLLDQISHYSRTASSIFWNGRNELNEGTWDAFTFTPPVEWLHLPLTLGQNWAGQSTFTIDGQQARVIYEAEVTDIRDVAPDLLRSKSRAGWRPGGERQGSWVFPDCAEVTLSYTLQSNVEGTWETMEAGSEVDLYCPGLGQIALHSENTSYGEGDPELRVEDSYLSWWLVGQ